MAAFYRARAATLLLAASAHAAGSCTRADLQTDAFLDNAVEVPWGTPEDTCTGGVPSGMVFADRRLIVDPDIGAVVILAKFTANDLPDSHLFRVERGRIRFVHSLTVCTVPGCGFPGRPPATR